MFHYTTLCKQEMSSLQARHIPRPPPFCQLYMEAKRVPENRGRPGTEVYYRHPLTRHYARIIRKCKQSQDNW